MLPKVLRSLKQSFGERRLPLPAKNELKRDRGGLPEHDPGIDAAVRHAMAWLARAQDCTASPDSGVARDFSLLSGWATSYPETTGYIIPTFLEYARLAADDDARERARRMLDWFVEIQLDGGGFQGGRIDMQPVVPVTFNTGQILIGLAAGVAEFGDAYRPAMRGAADFLRDSLDADGCWRSHPTPFAAPGEKTYETHVSWGLFEAARADSGRGYGAAGLRNVRWALTRQRDNGWFDDCCLNDPSQPLTHTIGYALRGILEAYRYSELPEFLEASLPVAGAIVDLTDACGYLPGRLDSNWQPTVSWVCLTGSVQLAHCLFLLHRYTGDPAYLDCGSRLTSYVRRTMNTDGPADVRGAIKGAFPVDGSYGAFEYLNWAAKFFVDANLAEREIRGAQQDAA